MDYENNMRGEWVMRKICEIVFSNLNLRLCEICEKI